MCLIVVYVRFAIAERPSKVEKLSLLNLSTGLDRVYYASEPFRATGSDQYEKPESHEKVILPSVITASEGFRAILKKLIAALGVEFRLLRAERSLVVLMPLAIFLSILELAFYEVVPDVSYSAAYASSTAKALLLFLLGMTVFYTGEAMHRDRDLRIEPVIWSLPAPNNVLLLSKFLATLLLTFSLIVLVGLTAIAVQLLKGDTPVNISAYLITYSVILLPSIVFMAGTSLALNVLLRDKYLAYAVSIGIGAGLFYLYGQGYKDWLYNPLLYQLWNDADLTGAGSNLATILMHRLYCLAIAIACLSLAHLFFERKSAKVLKTGARLSSSGWSTLILIVSVAVAVIAGLVIGAKR
jgi:ABC-type transport system involved in multi-copper enzyme maturation permease subunit